MPFACFRSARMRRWTSSEGETMSAKLFWVILASATCIGCTCNVSEQKKESLAKLETDVKSLVEEKKKTLEEELLAQSNEDFLLELPQQVDNEDLSEVDEGNARLHFDLSRQGAQKPGNKCHSP